MGEFCIHSPTHGQHTILFDDEDTPLVAGRTWCVVKRDKTFYAQTTVCIDGRKTKRYMHSLIMGVNGVDHINRNGLDNRRCNLRVCSSRLQMANQGSRGGSSLYKGVTWNKRRKKWCAKIQVCGKWYHLGYFDDELDAARAYDEAALAFHGAYACLNLGVRLKLTPLRFASTPPF